MKRANFLDSCSLRPRLQLAPRRQASRLLWVSPRSSSSRAPPSDRSPLAIRATPRSTSAGENGYNTFRIPSVIATARAPCSPSRKPGASGGGDAGDIDLVLKRSLDGGQTWSPLQVIGDNGPNTFGNPCPVVDRTTGTIWLLTTQNRGTDREKDIIAGTSQAGRSVPCCAARTTGSRGRRRRHHRKREAAGLDVVRNRPWRRDPDQNRPPGDPRKPRRPGHGHSSFTRRLQRRRRAQLADRRQRRRRAPTRARSSSWPTGG